jgi:putative transposase
MAVAITRLGRSGRIRIYGTADDRQNLQVQTHPITEQAQELGRVLDLCRWLCNTALERRILAWQRVRVSLSCFQQEAELKDIRAAFPEYATIHSHVPQGVLSRLDRTYQAFFRRVEAGDEVGFPRYQGHDRWHSFTYKGFGNEATLDNGFLVLSCCAVVPPD